MERDSKRAKPSNVRVAAHPVIQYKLSQLRKPQTGARSFRELLSEITLFLGFQATEDLADASRQVSFVPIMRSGLGLVDAMLTIVPKAVVHHIGMYNNPQSLLPVLYYNKLPSACSSDVVLVLDVQIGSGGTLIATVDIIKEWIGQRAVQIKVVSLVASKQGLEAFHKAHPEVEVHLAAVDESGESGLPVPGLGDPGNRMFNAE